MNKALSLDWVRMVGQRFEELRGESISGWAGVEMAMFDEGIDGLPQSEDPSAPFLQLASLDIELRSTRQRVACVQADDRFELFVKSVADRRTISDGIYRYTERLDVPVGLVESVEVTMEDGAIAEVALTVGGQSLLLLAGEVWEGKAYEGDGQTLTFHRFDESVLLFCNAADADALDWVPVRDT